MELLLAYTETPGPAKVLYEALNPDLPGVTARFIRIPEGALASDYALEAAQVIVESLEQAGIKGYTVGASYPPTPHPREEAERVRQERRRKPKDIEIGPTSGETVAKLTARIVTLERGYNRLLKFLADNGLSEGEETFR